MRTQSCETLSNVLSCYSMLQGRSCAQRQGQCTGPSIPKRQSKVCSAISPLVLRVRVLQNRYEGGDRSQELGESSLGLAEKCMTFLIQSDSPPSESNEKNQPLNRVSPERLRMPGDPQRHDIEG